jgi:NAD(P)-dependent dehydrogenase (short-subunit alcohol dehydrogenase family)
LASIEKTIMKLVNKMDINLPALLEQLNLEKGIFQNKVIVVTGAGRGIGLQTCQAFALLGGQVVMAEIDPEGKDAAEKIQSESGKAIYIQTDVSDVASVARLVKETHQQLGPVDIIINNAIRCPVAKVIEMDEALWDSVISVNLRGTFLVSKAFLPDMLSRKSGVIVNMVSAEAMPGLSAYIASKQGIVGFSQSLDLEVEDANIQVIPFGPGMVDTPGIRASASTLAPLLGMTEEQFLTTPLHASYDGLMPPEHAGAAVVYLVAKLAKELHGQVVTGYDVLETAGLLKVQGYEQAEANEPSQSPASVNAFDTIEQLDNILLETSEELNKLPAFIRPIARSGFKSKSGQNITDWQRSLLLLRSEMETGRPFSQTNLPVLLRRLIVYYRDVPKETARFTKDVDFLRQVGETSQRRVDIIERLIRLLEGG